MNLREKTLSFIEKYAFSNYAIILNTLIAYLAWQFKLTAAGMMTLGVISLIYAVTLKSLTPLLSILAVFTFSLSTSDVCHSTTLTVPMFVGLGLIAVAIIVFVIKNKIKIRPTANFWGVAALAFTLITGGLFSKVDINFTYWLILAGAALGIMGTYLLFSATIIGESKRYLAKSMLAVGLLICLQIFTKLLISNDPNVELTNKHLWLGWGITNAAATVFLMVIPFAVYLATTSKKPYFYLISTGILCIFMVLTFSRFCIMLLGLAFIPLFVLAIIKAQNRKATIITLSSMLVVGIVAIVLLFTLVFKDFMNIWSLGFDDRGRWELYFEAINVFQKFPIFGANLLYKFGERSSIIYYFHDTLLQFMASGGVVGIVCLFIHKIAQYMPFINRKIFKSKDTFCLFTILSLVLTEIHGMIDIIYYMQYYVIPIILIMAVGDGMLRQQDAERAVAEANPPARKKMLFGIDMKKTGFIAIALFVGTLGVQLLLMYAFKIPLYFTPWQLLIAAGITILLFALHEILHAFGYIVFCRVRPSDIKFGADKKLMTLYCHNKKPLPASEMLVAALLPLLFTGIIPAIAAILTGNIMLMLVAALLISGASGDIIMSLNLLKHKNNMVIDHPQLPAYYIAYEEDKLPAGFKEATPEIEEAYKSSLYKNNK